MADQVKSLDYKKRNAEYMTTVPLIFLKEVMALHEAIFQDD